jgi:DNA-binding protein HU-beta
VLAIDAVETRDLHCRSTDHVLASAEGALVNKNELVDAVAISTGLKKQEAEKAVDAVFDSISGELKKGSEVRLVGFGTFIVTNRAASEGRNPRTGEKIQIPASKLPKFRAGKQLKDSVQ